MVGFVLPCDFSLLGTDSISLRKSLRESRTNFHLVFYVCRLTFTVYSIGQEENNND